MWKRIARTIAFTLGFLLVTALSVFLLYPFAEFVSIHPVVALTCMYLVWCACVRKLRAQGWVPAGEGYAVFGPISVGYVLTALELFQGGFTVGLWWSSIYTSYVIAGNPKLR